MNKRSKMGNKGHVESISLTLKACVHWGTTHNAYYDWNSPKAGQNLEVVYVSQRTGVADWAKELKRHVFPNEGSPGSMEWRTDSFSKRVRVLEIPGRRSWKTTLFLKGCRCIRKLEESEAAFGGTTIIEVTPLLPCSFLPATTRSLWMFCPFSPVKFLLHTFFCTPFVCYR